MQILAKMLKPNIASMGYALFLAINATSVWGGVFPFLPQEFQTTELLTAFFLAQSIIFIASYFAGALNVYYFPGSIRHFIFIVAIVPYFIGWVSIIAAIYIPEFALALIIVGGIFIGFGSAGFYMLWQRLFASQDADTSNGNLIVGTLYASLLYYALYLIPQVVISFLIPVVFLPLFSLAVVLKSREIDFNQPMFQDVPHNQPAVYTTTLRDNLPSIFCIGALGFCCGIARSIAIETPDIGVFINIVSMLGAFIVAAVLLFVWRNNNIRLNIVTIYRVIFPIAITAFLIAPFAGSTYMTWFAALLYTVYSAAVLIMTIQCAQTSRNDGLNPLFIYGMFGGVVYLLHDLGFALGSFSEVFNFSNYNISSLGVICIVAIYLLGIMFFVSHGGFRNILAPHRSNVANVELISLNMPDLGTKTTETAGQRASLEETAPFRQESTTIQGAEEHPEAGSARADRQASSGAALSGTSAQATRPERKESPYRDRLSKQCALVQQHYRLTSREAEIMEFIARGNTIAHIAEELVLSENTIRTHSKRLYTKLDVHKRQELVDLINLFDPADLPHDDLRDTRDMHDSHDSRDLLGGTHT